MTRQPAFANMLPHEGIVHVVGPECFDGHRWNSQRFSDPGPYLVRMDQHHDWRACKGRTVSIQAYAGDWDLAAQIIDGGAEAVVWADEESVVWIEGPK